MMMMITVSITYTYLLTEAEMSLNIKFAGESFAQSVDTLLYESHPFCYSGFSLTSSESLACTKAATSCYKTHCIFDG